MSTLIATLRKVLQTPEAPLSEASQNFEEDDGYQGQFCPLSEGHSLHGECHYYTYARFSITRGIDVVNHVTDLNTKGITNPIASLTQHVNLGPRELEALFFAYLEWSLDDDEGTADDQ